MISRRLGLFILSTLAASGTACSETPGDDVEGGGLEPPPGFLERVDANCRAKADVTLSDDAPAVRQLNGQSLLTYVVTDGDKAQCAVRHADESVIDIRVLDVK